jgi:hypothetical protein
VQRSRAWANISEVNHRMSDDVSCFAYDQAQAAISMKERQPISAGTFVNAALAGARDLALPHQSLDQRCRLHVPV